MLEETSMSTLMGSKLATQKMRAIASSTTAGTSVKSPSIVRPKTSTSATIRTVATMLRPVAT